MQPDLDRDRMGEQSRRSQSARYLMCVPDQDRGKVISGDKIDFESVLDRDRLRLTIGLNRSVVTGVGQLEQGVRMGSADHLSQLVERAPLEIGHRVDADAVQFL